MEGDKGYELLQILWVGGNGSPVNPDNRNVLCIFLGYMEREGIGYRVEYPEEYGFRRAEIYVEAGKMGRARELWSEAWRMIYGQRMHERLQHTKPWDNSWRMIYE